MGFRLVLVALLLRGGIALAAEPLVPEAKKHVDAGVTHYDAGRYAEAVKEFELAYRLSNKPGLLFNIARAEAKLGHDEIAIAFLRRYLEERPDAPDASAVLAEIEARERALAASKEAAEAKQKAELESAKARKRVQELDDQARAAAALRAQAPPPTPAKPAPNWRPARYASYGLIAGGLAFLGAGIGMGVVASQAADDPALRQMNANWATCCEAIDSRGRLTNNLGIAFDVVGGVAVGAGVALLGWSIVAAREGRK